MHTKTSVLAICTVLALGGFGCVIKNDKKKGADTVTAAEALTKAVAFEGGELVDGLMPESTATGVKLLSSSDESIDPGASSLMSFDVSPGDSVVDSALIQFGDATSHFLIDSDAFVGSDTDAGAADGGTPDALHVGLSFKTARSVCDKLCDTVHDVEVIQAVKLHSGKISRHGSAILKLDCSEDGHHELCAETGDDTGKDAGRVGANPGQSDSGLVEAADAGRGATLTPMDVAAGACDTGQPQCNGMAEYQACVLDACDANYKECLGANFHSGDFSGSPCEAYGACINAAADPCTADCTMDQTCTDCFQGFSTCAQSCVPLLDCSNISGIDGGSTAFPDAGLPLGTGTCADLDACCESLTEATLQMQCKTTADSVRVGGDTFCGQVISSFCPLE